MHFAPFLRRAGPSRSARTSTSSPATTLMSGQSTPARHSIDLATPPRRPSHLASLPTPRRTAPPPTAPTRVSPTHSTASSGGDTLEDLTTDSDEDQEMPSRPRDIHHQPQSATRRSTRAPAPSTRSGPRTPTDDLPLSAVTINTVTSTATGPVSQPLRSQRSGSFLRMYEAGKGMLSNKASRGNLHHQRQSSIDDSMQYA